MSGSIPGTLTIAADMQPGWLITKSPDAASAVDVGFSQSMVTLSDNLTIAVRESALPSLSRNGSGSTSNPSATSSGGAPASCKSARYIPESGRQRHAACRCAMFQQSIFSNSDSLSLWRHSVFITNAEAAWERGAVVPVGPSIFISPYCLSLLFCSGLRAWMKYIGVKIPRRPASAIAAAQRFNVSDT